MFNHSHATLRNTQVFQLPKSHNDDTSKKATNKNHLAGIRLDLNKHQKHQKLPTNNHLSPLKFNNDRSPVPRQNKIQMPHLGR